MHVASRNLLMFCLCLLHVCIVHTFGTESMHILSCNLYAGCIYGVCIRFSYVYLAYMQYIMHINSTLAISEFAYVRSLQLCHAYA